MWIQQSLPVAPHAESVEILDSQSAKLAACAGLPDSATDSLPVWLQVDEAAARLKMEATSKPEALDEIERKVLSCPDALP